MPGWLCSRAYRSAEFVLVFEREAQQSVATLKFEFLGDVTTVVFDGAGADA